MSRHWRILKCLRDTVSLLLCQFYIFIKSNVKIFCSLKIGNNQKFPFLNHLCNQKLVWRLCLTNCLFFPVFQWINRYALKEDRGKVWWRRSYWSKKYEAKFRRNDRENFNQKFNILKTIKEPLKKFFFCEKKFK